MGFTQSCFIRKNSPELREKLVQLGYKPFGWVDYGFGLSTDILLKEYESFDDQGLINILKCGDTIDCDTNEDLFLALAALRDDTDINQWFIMDVSIYLNIEKDDWFIATDTKGGKHVGTQIDPLYCHKASVDEIIKKFNNI